MYIYVYIYIYVCMYVVHTCVNPRPHLLQVFLSANDKKETQKQDTGRAMTTEGRLRELGVFRLVFGGSPGR